jgi:hypothetical protein
MNPTHGSDGNGWVILGYAATFVPAVKNDFAASLTKVNLAL